MSDLAALVQALTVPVVLVELVAIFFLILARSASSFRGKRPIYAIQRRDLMLFGFFVVISFVQQVSRFLLGQGIDLDLGHQLWWTLGTDLAEVFIGGYCLFIELGVIGRRDP